MTLSSSCVFDLKCPSHTWSVLNHVTRLWGGIVKLIEFLGKYLIHSWSWRDCLAMSIKGMLLLNSHNVKTKFVKPHMCKDITHTKLEGAMVEIIKLKKKKLYPKTKSQLVFLTLWDVKNHHSSRILNYQLYLEKPVHIISFHPNWGMQIGIIKIWIQIICWKILFYTFLMINWL